ncbi:hypothetical protein BaRGS_00011213, partial [Batillaria attramentaria]
MADSAVSVTLVSDSECEAESGSEDDTEDEETQNVNQTSARPESGAQDYSVPLASNGDPPADTWTPGTAGIDYPHTRLSPNAGPEFHRPSSDEVLTDIFDFRQAHNQFIRVDANTRENHVESCIRQMVFGSAVNQHVQTAPQILTLVSNGQRIITDKVLTLPDCAGVEAVIVECVPIVWRIAHRPTWDQEVEGRWVLETRTLKENHIEDDDCPSFEDVQELVLQRNGTTSKDPVQGMRVCSEVEKEMFQTAPSVSTSNRGANHTTPPVRKSQCTQTASALECAAQAPTKSSSAAPEKEQTLEADPEQSTAGSNRRQNSNQSPSRPESRETTTGSRQKCKTGGHVRFSLDESEMPSTSSCDAGFKEICHKATAPVSAVDDSEDPHGQREFRRRRKIGRSTTLRESFHENPDGTWTKNQLSESETSLPADIGEQEYHNFMQLQQMPPRTSSTPSASTVVPFNPCLSIEPFYKYIDASILTTVAKYLGAEAMMVMRELQVTEDAIQQANEEHPKNPVERHFSCLKSWCQKFGAQANKEVLKNALRKHDRNDLVEKIDEIDAIDLYNELREAERLIQQHIAELNGGTASGNLGNAVLTVQKLLNETGIFDGACNNLLYPLWGAAFTVYRRELPHVYHDARLVSTECLKSLVTEQNRDLAKKHNQLLMQFGQFFSHDLSSTPEMEGIDCCDEDKLDANGLHSDTNIGGPCLPIPIPADDRYFNTCMPFNRSVHEIDSHGVAQQMNIDTAFVDHSSVYGSDDEFIQSIRAFEKGKLRVDDLGMLPQDNTQKCLLFPPIHGCPVG